VSKGKHDCATCGWGVRWDRSDYDGKLHGRCQFEPSIPVPRHYGFAAGFGEQTPMPTDCPAWKQPPDVNYVPQWKEEYLNYLLRGLQKIEERRAKIIAEDQEMAAMLGYI